MSAGEHRPTVARAFGDVERFLGLQQFQDRQVVDMTRVTIRELEAGDR